MRALRFYISLHSLYIFVYYVYESIIAEMAGSNAIATHKIFCFL
jgi:hypothetical protein